jgi:hypothetical protein
MNFTIFGVIFFVISILLYIFNIRYLVGLLIISLSFQMTSFVNINSINHGLQVYKVILSEFSLFIFFSLIKNNFKLVICCFDNTIINFLTKFIIYMLIISLIGPIIFNNMLVYSPKYSIDDNAVYGPFPLHFSLINIILPFNIILFYLTFISILSIKYYDKDFKFIINSFHFTIVLVLFFSFYQLFQSFIKLPDIFYFINNTITRKYHLLTVNLVNFNIFRIAATYYEPSNLAPFLISIFSFFLSAFILYRKYLSMLILSIVIILLSTSTTNYLSFFIMIFIVLIFTKVIFIKIKKNILKNFILLLLIVIMVISIIISLIGLNNIILILDEFLFNKSSSNSFLYRMSADIYSFMIFIKSYGLGVGIGSTRPSSLLPYLLSTVGIIGTILFFLFIVYFLIFSYKNLKNTPYYHYFFLVPGVLITQLVAYPDITNPTLWQMIYITSIIIKKVKDRYAK